MFPAPLNPTVVLQLNDQNQVVNTASNIDPELNVVIVRDENSFKEAAAGKPFDTTRKAE